MSSQEGQPACTVAPHVGAWIETEMVSEYSKRMLSLPMWERGLKPPFLMLTLHQDVAPHVGAWIETRYY